MDKVTFNCSQVRGRMRHQTFLASKSQTVSGGKRSRRGRSLVSNACQINWNKVCASASLFSGLVLHNPGTQVKIGTDMTERDFGSLYLQC